MNETKYCACQISEIPSKPFTQSGKRNSIETASIILEVVPSLVKSYEFPEAEQLQYEVVVSLFPQTAYVNTTIVHCYVGAVLATVKRNPKGMLATMQYFHHGIHINEFPS